LYCSHLFVPLQLEIELYNQKTMKKRFFAGMLMGLVTMGSMAQISKTLSPYTQFGLGALADQSQSLGRGMGGLSVGVRDGKFANVSNPASYSAVDSLTMIFDLGVSGQITNFKEGGKSMNRKTASFDYAVGLFRLFPHVGASFGVIPYTNIGYNYYDVQGAGESGSLVSTSYFSSEYEGKGGLSQAFFGLGWEFVKNVSIGANISYLWGDYEKTITSISDDSYINTLGRTYDASINTWKLDLGAQWAMNLGKENHLTLGVTAGIGHKLGADANLTILNTNSQTGVVTMTTDSVSNGLEIPYSFAGGFSYVHKNSLTVGADYSLQKWGVLHFPEVNESTMRYESTSGLLKDRHKVVVGADWIPYPMTGGRGFFSHVHYRVGASYTTPYYKIGTQDGPKELSISAGFGIPIVNSWNNRTSLNISAQWVHQSAKNFITENSFRINIGLTFNERWFAKWKVD